MNATTEPTAPTTGDAEAVRADLRVRRDCCERLALHHERTGDLLNACALWREALRCARLLAEMPAPVAQLTDAR
jgi:hypothetical protein